MKTCTAAMFWKIVLNCCQCVCGHKTIGGVVLLLLYHGLRIVQVLMFVLNCWPLDPSVMCTHWTHITCVLHCSTILYYTGSFLLAELPRPLNPKKPFTLLLLTLRNSILKILLLECNSIHKIPKGEAKGLIPYFLHINIKADTESFSACG